jgi:hypothetical protein
MNGVHEFLTLEGALPFIDLQDFSQEKLNFEQPPHIINAPVETTWWELCQIILSGGFSFALFAAVALSIAWCLRTVCESWESQCVLVSLSTDAGRVGAVVVSRDEPIKSWLRQQIVALQSSALHSLGFSRTGYSTMRVEVVDDRGGLIREILLGYVNDGKVAWDTKHESALKFADVAKRKTAIFCKFCVS